METIARGMLNEVAEDVWYLPVVMANVYFVGKRTGPWVLVDTGVRGSAGRIRRAAEKLFSVPPEAIILTHGHFDHIGGLPQLADYWGVPVHAHALEVPFLTGRADYPPPDPTVGGFMAQMSRTFSNKGINLGGRVRVFPAVHSIPGLPGWSVVHTPGHTAGHVSLFRESDRTLIAGDAVITVNQENAGKLLAQVQELRNPPAYFTQDWEAARESVHRLAELRPRVIAAGHGLPVTGDWVADELQRFAGNFRPPAKGRYVRTPARTDENGILSIPPAPPDMLPQYAAGIALAAAAGMLLAAALRRRGGRQPEYAAPARLQGQEPIARKPAYEYEVPPRLSPSTEVPVSDAEPYSAAEHQPDYRVPPRLG
jgi:glyoxylase-like metal-dependent hydrolase (beta-lactamase superfamily II)